MEIEYTSLSPLLPLLFYLFSLDYDLNLSSLNAKAACRVSMAWRETNKEQISKIREGEKVPFDDVICKYRVASRHGFTKGGDLIFITRVGLGNMKGLMDTLSEDQVLQSKLLSREEAFMYCDQETRKRGKLVHSLTLLDMKGVTLWSFLQSNDPRFSKVLTKVSHMAEKLYPKLAKNIVILNCPSFIVNSVTFIKPFIGKETLSKIMFCTSSDWSLHGNCASKCPFVTANIDLDSLPSFLGGKCECKDKGGRMIKPPPPRLISF